MKSLGKICHCQQNVPQLSMISFRYPTSIMIKLQATHVNTDPESGTGIQNKYYGHPNLLIICMIYKQIVSFCNQKFQFESEGTVHRKLGLFKTPKVPPY